MLNYCESDKVAVLRDTLRTLVRDHFPAGYLGAFTNDPADFEISQSFCRELGNRSLLAMAWPVEFGGAAANAWEQTALREEMWAAHEPRGAQYMGVNWVGPVIMRHGTENQKIKHLPAIAAGDIVWCQGFSEPGAGSDLPALRTKASKVDGGWSITGQKVWTSYASMADMCFLLARTGEANGRKVGITVFLVDMKTTGIAVVPIKSMLGSHHLNEVYLDSVFVSDENVLGEVGSGWSIIAEVLGFERVGIARYARSERLLREAPESIGEARWKALPESVRMAWADCLVRARQVKLLAYRLLDEDPAASMSAADAAVYRIAVTTFDQESAEVLMEILENQSLGNKDRSEIFEREVEGHWRYAQAATVASGTVEINKVTITKSLEAS